MGRDKVRITDLNLDYAAGIRKLSNGNLKYFFDTYIRNEIPLLEFYKAMRFLEPISPNVEREIEDAYFEALNELGLTHDSLSEIPTFSRLHAQIEEKLMYLESDATTLSKEEITKFKIAFKFYRIMFDKGLIQLVEKKKARVIG